jgi:hypothetical protein
MPLPVSNLDDTNFDKLAAEALALIPKNFPLWTDHNFSDPGRTLLELFAFLIEAAIYQLNRLPERSLVRFAELVGVTRQIEGGEPEPIEQTLRRALEVLKREYRAITEEEFERLAKQAAPEQVARANAIFDPAEQIIKVVVVPNDPVSPRPIPTPELRQTVFDFLNPRRLITTRLQVVEPVFTPVSVAVTAVREFASPLDRDAVQDIEQAIRCFLNPLTGGVGSRGWEFGRPVFRSELFQVVEGVPGVDHVRRLGLNGNEELPEVSVRSISLVELDQLTVIVTDA